MNTLTLRAKAALQKKIADVDPPVVCDEPGCNQGPETGVTLFDAGKGKWCAKHFTSDKHAVEPA